MVSQRKVAAVFLVILLLTFLWEKHDLQLRAHAVRKEIRLWHQLRSKASTTDRSESWGRGKLPGHMMTPIRNMNNFSHFTLQNSHKHDTLLSTPYKLSFAEGPVIPANSTCPLPVLHPHKWVDVMGWGVRKSFPSCKSGLPFSTVAEEQLNDGEWARSLTFRRSFEKCDGRRRAWAFGERRTWRRMTSTYDAEVRQNELRDIFAFKNVANFAQEIPIDTEDVINGIRKPYVLAQCGDEVELHVRSALLHDEKNTPRVRPGALKNILHVMFDSTSVYALRRGAKKVIEWMESVNNDPSRSSNVYPMLRAHAVSCCSPGNQIPMYSGAMNGEGDYFVNSEPFPDSNDWLWNIASKQGFRTFWSIDNCPDKSARDYHAYPTVDSRVVAPLCIAGVLLSHKDWTCLGGKSVDQHVLDGLSSFWAQFKDEPKFATIQFITPHEETEKLLIEADELTANYFRKMEMDGELNDTAIVFWSDHGINFGKYASTHDGEIEKMFPFVNFILPKWFSAPFNEALRHNADKLTTLYDMYEATRTLLYYPDRPPPFAHDKRNPPRPKPSQSHIVASFQKEIAPADVMRTKLHYNRSCWDANIPMEFCTCIPWKSAPQMHKFTRFVELSVRAHSRILVNYTALCHPVVLSETISLEWQQWPTEYHPKEQRHAKQIWMKPNRDMVKVVYRTAEPGAGIFEAVFSVDKQDEDIYDVASVSRMDAIRKKCGIVQKRAEHLCVCK